MYFFILDINKITSELGSRPDMKKAVKSVLDLPPFVCAENTGLFNFSLNFLYFRLTSY
jgi:hypothetical protein